MKKWFSVFFIYLISTAFQPAFNQDMLTDKFIVDKLVAKTGNPSLKTYQGSPYLIDSFVAGKITMNSNASFSIPIRYNLYEDAFEVKFNGRDMELGQVDFIKKIELAEYRFVLNYYPGDKGNKKGFLFLLDSGKLSLLQKRYVVFEEWQPTKALESGPTPAKFRDDRTDFFIWNNRGTITKLKTIKEIPELLPDNRVKIEAYLKENKTKLKSDHLTRLFQYYNSL